MEGRNGLALHFGGNSRSEPAGSCYEFLTDVTIVAFSVGCFFFSLGGPH